MNSRQDTANNLYDLIDDFHNGILTTKALDGGLHSRPMAIAQVTPNGEVLLISDIESQKIDEALKDPHASLTFQSDPGKHVALSGQISVSRNREKIEAVWNKHIEAWFKDEAHASDAALLIFKPQRGEYWDTSGIKAVRYALTVATSNVLGGRPELDEERHARVKL